ncbi:unnamed protein product [Leptidea sinapis]|uniref:Uncharacterized protein n=1 Tax=Leptidea sinapis TaxID=189913 RepID=A0A5E4R7I1_9NEOP|nr:unnamed protein product [Leptidea sinapis]
MTGIGRIIILTSSVLSNRAKWGLRNNDQINQYHALCDIEFKTIGIPPEQLWGYSVQIGTCCDVYCNNTSHQAILDNM